MLLFIKNYQTLQELIDTIIHFNNNILWIARTERPCQFSFYIPTYYFFFYIIIILKL